MRIAPNPTPVVADLGSHAEFQAVAGANPAVNTEASITVPAGHHYELLSFSVSLVGGAAATEFPALRITDGTNVLLQVDCATADQDAGVTCRYTWAPGLVQQGAGATATSAQAPIPEGLVLPPGSVIGTVTDGIAADSDYGVPVALVVDYH